MSELYRYLGDIKPELWSQDYRDNWVPVEPDGYFINAGGPHDPWPCSEKDATHVLIRIEDE